MTITAAILIIVIVIIIVVVVVVATHALLFVRALNGENEHLECVGGSAVNVNTTCAFDSFVTTTRVRLIRSSQQQSIRLRSLLSFSSSQNALTDWRSECAPPAARATHRPPVDSAATDGCCCRVFTGSENEVKTSCNGCVNGGLLPFAIVHLWSVPLFRSAPRHACYPPAHTTRPANISRWRVVWRSYQTLNQCNGRFAAVRQRQAARARRQTTHNHAKRTRVSAKRRSRCTRVSAKRVSSCVVAIESMVYELN